MTYLITKFLIISALFGVSNDTRIEASEYEVLKKEFIKTKASFAKAHCFCRIGNDRGPRVDEYPNSIKDFGRIKQYNGLNPQRRKNQDDCSRRCAIQAESYLNSLSPDDLCKLFRKTGTVKALAYSKVGTKSLQVFLFTRTLLYIVTIIKYV